MFPRSLARSLSRRLPTDSAIGPGRSILNCAALRRFSLWHCWLPLTSHKRSPSTINHRSTHRLRPLPSTGRTFAITPMPSACSAPTGPSSYALFSPALGCTDAVLPPTNSLPLRHAFKNLIGTDPIESLVSFGATNSLLADLHMIVLSQASTLREVRRATPAPTPSSTPLSPSRYSCGSRLANTSWSGNRYRRPQARYCSIVEESIVLYSSIKRRSSNKS